MVLIVDAGSTKTEWVMGETRITTAGINPYHHSEEYICAILEDVRAVLTDAPTHIYYYGAGCRADTAPILQYCFTNTFHSSLFTLHLNSDVVGAARALFGDGQGVACILGTGSNACLYDGREVVRGVSPLGYILGDEGSGAVLGQRFVNALFKGRIGDDVKGEFISTFGDESTVIGNVYRGETPARFLASMAPFIHAHREVTSVRAIIVDNFREFIRYNVLPLEASCDIGAVGSIAYYFSDELRAAAALEGVRISTILQRPIDRLVEYHTGLSHKCH